MSAVLFLLAVYQKEVSEEFNNHEYIFFYDFFSNFLELINKILTLRFWIPLSRLTYSAYLIHCTVIFYFYTTQERAMHIQDINMVAIFFTVSSDPTP